MQHSDLIYVYIAMVTIFYTIYFIIILFSSQHLSLPAIFKNLLIYFPFLDTGYKFPVNRGPVL